MPALPEALEAAIVELGRLPGIGRRSAERLAFGLLAAGAQRAEGLSRAITRLAQEIGSCPVCHYFTDRGTCPLCSDASRAEDVLCVVEDALDVIAFEKAGGFRGRYHVLGGALAPLKGVGPDDLHVGDLAGRAASPAVRELILATSPGMEGDATALYLSKRLAREGLAITRIGRGVPVGGSLEFADPGTLRLALEGRRAV